MKRFFKYALIGLSLLGISLTANAQMAYNTAGGVTTGKQVTGPNPDGSYTITLETYAEGESDYSEKASDIILVLDMSGSMEDPYVATENRTWTVSDIQNSEVDLYYRQRDYQDRWWDYYKLSVTGSGNNRSIRGYCSFNGNTINLGQSFAAVLYHDIKLDAMKSAVNTFINIVNDNDRLKEDGTTLRNKRLGNRIAIVTFSNNSTNLASWTLLGNNALDVNNQTGFNSLTRSVTNLNNPEGGTYVNYGMSAASTLMNSANANSNKTVVLFTDGIPGGGSWNSTGRNSANGAISNANTIKGSDGTRATVWTVGIFEDMSDSDKSNTDIYMNRVSSNFIGVTNMTSTASPVADKYYIEATAGSSLSQIFADIASESTKHESIPASTQVKDVVSSSFTLPSNASADDIEYYTEDIAIDGLSWGNKKTPAGVSVTLTETQKVVDNQPVVDEEGKPVMLKTVQVSGFDYTLDDTTPGSGDGNWVGPRTVQGDTKYYGKRLVVKFNIVQVGDVTGGAGTNTNTSQSGVYVLKPDGSYENINNFVVPHTTLPINLKITKTGLRHGESATFEVERCRPKNWDETKSLAENLAAMEYNALNKPVPSGNWKNWSKVIVTNKGKNGDPVVKTLVSLDPYYVYRISEDTWSWAYDAISTSGQSSETTSTVEVNPFKFQNQAKTGDNIPKHAEAVTINHFNFTVDGKQEEHYKSSKDQFQTNPTTD